MRALEILAIALLPEDVIQCAVAGAMIWFLFFRFVFWMGGLLLLLT